MEISHPVFHDIIKAVIHYDREKVFEVCRGYPITKDSRIFRNSYWRFDTSDQEHLMQAQNRILTKADVVWFFSPSEVVYPLNQQYIIIHEVKTGNYNTTEIFEKYYAWNNSQIWIWGWPKYHQENPPRILKLKRSVRQCDISLLKPLYQPLLIQFTNGG